MDDIAIVIVNWNGRELLARCLRSVAETAGTLRLSVWVVDNGSTDGSVAMVRDEFPHVHLLDPQANLGFAGGNNLALRQVLGFGCQVLETTSPISSTQYPIPAYVLLLNPDTVVKPGALQALLRYMDANPHIGVTGALLLNEDSSFQASHVLFPTVLREFLILSGLGRKRYGEAYPSASFGESHTARDDIDYVVGACMLARTTAVEQVGLLDDGFFMYSEEVDWCYRFKEQGWAVAYTPDAEIIHLGGGSTRQVRPQMQAELYRSRVRFFRKHYGAWSAGALRGLLLVMNGAKLLRVALRPDQQKGTPPLSWPLLRHAISVAPTSDNRNAKPA